MRLNKAIAMCGIASRRASDKLIEEGKVTVNGIKAVIGMEVDPEKDHIKVNGRLIRPIKEHVHILLYKPKETLCSSNDPEGRAIVKDLIKEYQDRRLFTVGRLDYHTEGLIILTDDGEFASKVGHPSTSPEKTYHVRVRGIPDEKALEKLRNGIVIEGYKTKPSVVKMIRKAKNVWLEMTITEGKNRQIRKMIEAIDHQVVKLRRVKIGELTTAGLKPGYYRLLTKTEIGRLAKAHKSSNQPRDKRRAKK